MTAPGPISADRLKSFIERIEKLETERAAISGDIRDVYSEAKGVGYDVKTMRRIVQLRKKDAAERDEEEQLLDVYVHALGMVTGNADVSALGSSRGPTEDDLMAFAAKVVGEVELCLSELVVNGRHPKIEAIKALIGCSTGKAHKLRALVIERIEGFSRSMADDDENENRETADLRNTPAGDGIEALPPDGQGAVAGNPIEDAAGRSPGDEGDGNARTNPRGGIRSGYRCADDGDGEPDGPDVRHGTPVGPITGPDRVSSGTVRPEASSGRWNEDGADAGTEARISGGAACGDKLDGRRPESPGRDQRATQRVAVDDDLAIPPFLDQRHKARATG